MARHGKFGLLCFLKQLWRESGGAHRHLRKVVSSTAELRAILENSGIFMWPDDSLENWAFHEAGHAVAMALVEFPFTSVVIGDNERCVRNNAKDPIFSEVDFTVPTDLEAASQLNWPPEARRLIGRSLVTYAAGPIAQMRFEGKPLPGDLHEFHLFGGVTDAGIICGYALGLAALEARGTEAVRRMKKTLVEDTIGKAGRLVTDYWPTIEVVSTRLIEERHLSSIEVAKIVDQTDTSPSGEDGA
ncbi:MAG TPA: hypothetical protein VKA32_04395 [Gammaproteobacteria bacterium]|nr:hypothetical protein [Gammaproteobacteria bacterium]